MWTLYKKELSNFFSSLIGYLTIAVFLILTGLMLWVLKSDFNILDYGYAGMDGLFLIGPFLYLFLIPAITMRTFAEERRGGTIEMLMTRPLSDWTIVWAKFLAAWTLVLHLAAAHAGVLLQRLLAGRPRGQHRHRQRHGLLHRPAAAGRRLCGHRPASAAR